MGQDRVAQKRELFQKYYQMACHNLLCCSKNYGMTEAQEGFEEEWKQYQVECDLLQEMMTELDAQEQKKTPLQRREEARYYVNEVLVKEKGLRLYDVSRLVGCCRPVLSRFVRGENVGGERLVEQILAFKERLQRPVFVEDIIRHPYRHEY